MTRTEKILGINRARGESALRFREKIEDVMMQYGYVQKGDFEEQNGKVSVHTYGGINDQFLVSKFAVREDGKLFFGAGENSESDKKYDMLISMKGIPQKIMDNLSVDLVKYNGVKQTKDFGCQNIVGVLKKSDEFRGEFRKRLDDFLGYQGFRGGNFLIEGEWDEFLYKDYQKLEGQMIYVTCARDDTADSCGFDYIEQKDFEPYDSENSDNLVDAALIFAGIPEDVEIRICKGLEEKFNL